MRKQNFAQGGQSILEFALLGGLVLVVVCSLSLLKAVKQTDLTLILSIVIGLGMLVGIAFAAMLIKKRAQM